MIKKLTKTCLLATISLTALLVSSASAIEVGTNAPAASAKNHTGEDVSMVDLFKKGPVLVYFYPKSDTPGCTKQACNLRDNFTALTDEGVIVVGVSTDDVEAQAKFREKYKLPFILLADTEGIVCKAFNVPTRGGKFAARQSFLIVDNKVKWFDLKATPTTQAEDALAALKAE